jgi:hypothetical protein
VRFAVGRYDRTRPLVVDPLVYSRFVGGTGSDAATGIAVDTRGNAYITGVTSSSDFPILGAFQSTFNKGGYDAFVTELDANGSLLYSTYLGGDSEDLGTAISIDSNLVVNVAGYTGSSNFPTMKGFQTALAGVYDLFVTRLDTRGVLLVSTYLGGGNLDIVQSMATDKAGNAYLTGYTRSNDFPRVQAVQQKLYGGEDLFVSSISPDGLLGYSTYLGGSLNERGIGIAADPEGNVVLTGYTQSGDFPTKDALQPALAGATNAFVTKLNPVGTLAFSTFLGGSSNDRGAGVTIDRVGNIWVTGATQSLNFPTRDAAQPTYGHGNSDGFITHFAPDGTLAYSSYLGATGDDYCQFIAQNSRGYIAVGGLTTSDDFPTPYGEQTNFGGGLYDIFITMWYGPEKPMYATYLGGSGDDGIGGIAIGSNDLADEGGIFVAGGTASPDFPRTGDFPSSNNVQETGDAFVTRIRPFIDNGVPQVHLIGFDLAPVSVDPVANELNLTFTLPKAASITVELFNTEGRRASIPIDAREYASGRHSVAISTAGFPSGSYLLRLTSGSDSRTSQFIVIR